MYQWQYPKNPILISRNTFINKVFNLSNQYNHGYDSMVQSVIIADNFISSTEPRIPYIFTDKSIDSDFNKLTPQIYSIELAHVVVLISGKLNEDSGYIKTMSAIYDTNNIYISKMEYELYYISNFNFKIHNFISLLGKLHSILNINLNLGTMCFDLSKYICKNKSLLFCSPSTIILAIILLHKIHKLSIIKTHKYRIFKLLITNISIIYDLDISIILHSFNIPDVKIKNDNNYIIYQ